EPAMAFSSTSGGISKPAYTQCIETGQFVRFLFCKPLIDNYLELWCISWRKKAKQRSMFRNIILVAFRNLWRNKSFSTINILGLAIGMAAALLIGLWVQNEFSYDS